MAAVGRPVFVDMGRWRAMAWEARNMNDMVSMRRMAPGVEFAGAGLDGSAFAAVDSDPGLGFEDDFLGGNEGSLAGQWPRQSPLESAGGSAAPQCFPEARTAGQLRPPRRGTSSVSAATVALGSKAELPARTTESRGRR